jgi:ribonuclease P protein subunit POP4
MTQKAAHKIMHDEVIGLKVKIIKSAHPGYVGIEGIVVDETQKTITVLHEGKRKDIVKKASIFQFTLPDGALTEIDGRGLVGRPEDRIR